MYLFLVVGNPPAYVIWLGIALVFLLLGLTVGEPTTVSLAIAAIITAIAAITVPSVTVQVILWCILSVSLAVILRGMVPRRSKDLLPGDQAVVLETIPKGGIGRVSYEGVLWRARCQISDVTIAPGQTVDVVDRQGLTLIVMPATFDDYQDTYSAS